MRKLVLWAVAGILLLFGAAVALILGLGDSSSLIGGAVVGPADPASGAASPSGPPPPALANLPMPPSSPGSPPIAPPIQYGPPPTRPPEGSWEAVAPVARPAALGRIGAAIGRELNEIQPHVAECFAAATAARHSGQAVSSVQDEAPLDDAGTTILMLQVETLEGQVRIVDAPVETRGRAGDAVIACVQQALRGQTFAVPDARPGSRHRILYTLTQ